MAIAMIWMTLSWLLNIIFTFYQAEATKFANYYTRMGLVLKPSKLNKKTGN